MSVLCNMLSHVAFHDRAYVTVSSPYQYLCYLRCSPGCRSFLPDNLSALLSSNPRVCMSVQCTYECAVYTYECAVYECAVYECAVYECAVYECAVYECAVYMSYEVYECAVYECAVYECAVYMSYECAVLANN